MTLTDKNTGKLVHSWVSGTEPEKLVMTGNTGEVLVAGHTYIMHEESAPEGYAQAADVEFYFNGDRHHPPLWLPPGQDGGPSRAQRRHRAILRRTRTNATGWWSTPGKPGDDPNTPGNAIPNGDGDTPKISPTAPPNVPAFANGQYGLPTGDSPMMWIFLALAVVCIGAAVGVTVVRKKKENGDDASHSDRG